MKQHEKYDNLIAKYFAGEMTAAEQSELMNWVEASESNRTYFASLETLWNVATPVSEPFFENNWESSWDAVETAIQEPKEAKIRRLGGNRFQLRIAAVLMIGLALSIWYLYQRDISPTMLLAQTAANEKLEVNLPDGTKVWLNENSQLTYDSLFTERVVHLEGEGFFDVTKQEGASFEIYSGETVTTVLGTSFYVRAYPAEAKVSVNVVTGKVKLSSTVDETEHTILLPGASATLDEEKVVFIATEKPDQNASFWHTKSLQFNDDLMALVIQQLENKYEAKISLSDPTIANCHYKGEFMDRSLKEVMEAIAFTLQLELIETNGQFTLSGNGCE